VNDFVDRFVVTDSQIELFNLYDDHVSEFKMLLEAWSKKNIWRFW